MKGRIVNLSDMFDSAIDACESRDFETSTRLGMALEDELEFLTDKDILRWLLPGLGGLFTDLGSDQSDQELLNRGIMHTQAAIDGFPESDRVGDYYYNLGNGYFSLWELLKEKSSASGRLGDNYVEAKKAYREAINQGAGDDPRVWTNLGNLMRTVGRVVEAASCYERALELDSKMGMALGNKGRLLFDLAPLAVGARHHFYLEAHRLLSEAIVQMPKHTLFRDIVKCCGSAISGSDPFRYILSQQG